jgi:fatty acid desaturase
MHATTPTPAQTSLALWQRQEWPTWALIVGVYVSWVLLMVYVKQLTWWLASPLGAIIICLHGSVQHELLHEHPSPWRGLNDMLAWPPLSLWIPYAQYRDYHRAHHQTATLSQPGLDPESYYLWREDWRTMSRFMRMLWHINYTFAGRMLVGPWLVVIQFFISEAKHLAKGSRSHWRSWSVHLLLVTVLLLWLHSQGVIWWQYILFCVWPGLSLTLMRSYTEHRPGNNNHQSCAIVEGSWFTRILFMNVNLHQVHHEFPQLAWFMVHGHWRQNRHSILERNGGFYYRGYWQLMCQHMLRQKDSPVYPKNKP